MRTARDAKKGRVAWALAWAGTLACAQAAPEPVAPALVAPPPAIADGPAPAAPPWCASPSDPADLSSFANDDVRFAIECAAGRVMTEAGEDPRVTCGAVTKIRALSIPRVASLSGFEHLTSLTRLTVVGVDDGDLGPLSRLPLEALDVGLPIHLLAKDSAPEIDDLSPLASVTTLRSLRVAGARVVDVSPLHGLAQLQSLVLPSNRIADVSPLAALGSLVTLTLDDNSITDIAPLAKLASLTELRLTRNPIVDLPNLSGLRALSMLVLDGTRVLDAAPLLTLPSPGQVVLCGAPVIEDPKVRARNAATLTALRRKKVSVPDFVGCHTG